MLTTLCRGVVVVNVSGAGASENSLYVSYARQVQRQCRHPSRRMRQLAEHRLPDPDRPRSLDCQRVGACAERRRRRGMRFALRSLAAQRRQTSLLAQRVKELTTSWAAWGLILSDRGPTLRLSDWNTACR